MEAQNMEHSAKGIQMDTEQQLETSNTTDPIIAPDSPDKKASIFCFKKRKKYCEKGEEKDENHESNSLSLRPANQSSDMGHNETEVSNPFWTSGGAWLAFKRLVTLRRRSKSSLKKQTQACSRVHLDVDIGDSGRTRFPKDHASSGSKIPCLKLSRNKKRASHSEIIEQPDCEKKGNDTASILNNKSNEEPEMVAMEVPLDTKLSPSRGLQEEESDSGAMTNTENASLSNRENAFPDPNCYIDCGVPSEIIHSETALVTEEEKQIFQLHHGTLYGNFEELENQKFSFNVEISPPIPQDLPESEQQLIGREGTKETKSQPFGAGIDVVAKSEDAAAKEGHSIEVMLHCSPSVMEDEASDIPVCFDEEEKNEVNQFTIPGAGIVIMITEAEDDQDEEEESAPTCEMFAFPQAIKQKGKKKTSKNKASTAGCNYAKEDQACSQVPSSFGTNSQEHWTSEQYEMLLIETAASLVKTAIQSSVEQLVNEMALEQNKQNSVL
ncbi:A-kinase anchor protein 5 [Pantherophis guttatus]|uniref:A-kinase anchor protein 5 n=1 Tax=Pantherophis guttatus TaxID=94885 RepID=A0A6P9D1J1_PANGU|nr:A-kinase anchor protein 5 [Pantherophis guttatus]XP_034289467.1 A-kinase anchor protein 5 [Pantherophis guttatus]